MNKWRNKFITVFVIFWCLAFHYESVRHFYLNPLIGKQLPKIKFLFPPAGWIMFFRVDSEFGTRKIYGIKEEQFYEIDPHEVFRVRTIGYDNIHRGVITSAAAPRRARQFCRQLERRFGYYDDFVIAVQHYPDFVNEPHRRLQQPEYQCSALKGN